MPAKARIFHDQALAALRRDVRLAAVIDRVGPYLPSPRGDSFAALVRAIVSQQVSKYAAEAILGRLHALFEDGRPDPKMLLAIKTAKLRKCGLSKRKAEYLRDLAAHVADRRIDFVKLARLPDEEIIEKLTAIRGIGRWTAEMYLLFTLGRLDVLPLGDAALVNAVREIYTLPGHADAEHFGAIAESWRPWRGIACWYLYRSINMERAARAAAQAAERAERRAAKLGARRVA